MELLVREELGLFKNNRHLLALLHADNLRLDLFGGRHLAAEVAKEVDRLCAVDGELDVLEHLAFVQLDIEHSLHARLLRSLLDGVVRERPNGDRADQTNVDALLLELNDRRLGNTRNRAESGDDILSTLEVVLFPLLLVGSDLTIAGLQLVVVDGQGLGIDVDGVDDAALGRIVARFPAGAGPGLLLRVDLVVDHLGHLHGLHHLSDDAVSQEEDRYTVLFSLVESVHHDVDGFLHYRWINKILNTFYNASLIDEITCKKFSAIANNYYEGGFKALLGYEVGKYRRGHYKSMDRAYSEAFKSLKDVLEHKIPKILSLFESIVVFVAKQEGIGVETFSLSRVRRYYETGVKSLLGEALIEYGFPTDAIRRIEENHKKIKSMTVSEAKEYCRLHFREVQLLLDTYERSLFIKAMRTF